MYVTLPWHKPTSEVQLLYNGFQQANHFSIITIYRAAEMSECTSNIPNINRYVTVWRLLIPLDEDVQQWMGFRVCMVAVIGQSVRPPLCKPPSIYNSQLTIKRNSSHLDILVCSLSLLVLFLAKFLLNSICALSIKSSDINITWS